MIEKAQEMAKNIFDFATKELSQDAFLRWLIESVDDSGVAPVSLAFLKWTTGYAGRIEVIKTFAQWHRIDVVAELSYPEDSKTVLLAIEDKINSGEHDNQLKRYNESLEKWRSDESTGKRSTEKVFYKTSRLDEKEKKQIEKAGWRVFELDDIVSFFKKYECFENSEIISSYVKHVLRRKQVTTQPMQSWDLIDFETWYWESFRPHVIKAFSQLNFEGKIYQGHYFSCFVSRPYKDSKNQSVCLEIKFRPKHEISGVIYPRRDGGIDSLPDKAWEVSDDYRRQLLEIVKRQGTTKWSSFRHPNRNPSVRIGALKENISLDGKTPDEIISRLMDVFEEFNALFNVNSKKSLPKCRRASCS